MCDHKFIILTTEELELIAEPNRDPNGPASTKACCTCGELRFKYSGMDSWGISNIFDYYANAHAKPSYYIERLTLFCGEWGRPLTK